VLKKDGWYVISIKRTHVKLRHDIKQGTIIFPNHGSKELGKGLENKLRKDAQLKRKK